MFGKQNKPREMLGKKNGAGGYRSPCLVHAKHALYHLSYTPFTAEDNFLCGT